MVHVSSGHSVHYTSILVLSHHRPPATEEKNKHHAYRAKKVSLTSFHQFFLQKFCVMCEHLVSSTEFSISPVSLRALKATALNLTIYIMEPSLP